VWRHRSVSLNNEKTCCEIIEDKIAFCEKTAGLRRGKFSDSNSACLKVLVPVKIFQFQDMFNESERYQDAANGLYIRGLGLSQTDTHLFQLVSTQFTDN
jgi:hypothetical protein